MLELKNISAGYGKTTVLHDLSVCFQKGELTGIIGSNGCGKSTLLKTALGILPGNRGEVLINGANISGRKRKEIAKHMAYLAQGKNIPDMTVEQMVLHGRFPHLRYPKRYTSLDREIAFQAMEQVGISKFSGMPVSALSGGMRQTADIAMALAQDAEYILLDEPTTYLDISHQIKLIKTLRSLTENQKGIIAVMHDLPLAFTFSDKIAVINGGTLAIQGSPKEVYESGIVEKLLGVSLTITEEGSYRYRYFS